MDLGNKIMNLRKKANMSQEDLAEQLGVTRQTISKWEVGETSPDIKQAKELSRVFKVSLDDLVNNDINNIIVEKVSNTERLAGLIIKIIKFIGIGFVTLLVLELIIFFVYAKYRSENNTVVGSYEINCQLDNESYLYEIEYNKNYQIKTIGGDAWIASHTDVDKYSDANKAKAHIEDWFKDHNGSCETKDNKEN